MGSAIDSTSGVWHGAIDNSVLTHRERLERIHVWTLEETRNWSDPIKVFKMVKRYVKCDRSDFFIFDNGYKGMRVHCTAK